MLRLKEKMASKIELKIDQINKIKEHSQIKIGDVTLSHILRGMRGLKVLPSETSYLDPYEGIRFRGYTVQEVLEKLPKPAGSEMPYNEAQFYLLMTGDIPTEEELIEVIEIFKEKREVPKYVFDALNAFPVNARSDAMLAAAIDSMEWESAFLKACNDRKITKINAWEYMFEDVLNLLPKIPVIAAYIYRLKYKDNNQIPPDKDLDFGGNFAHMMGIDKPYDDFSRLYFTLLSDHESGNVFAHTTLLVASAWADAYYSLAAGVNGLAGLLHGGATREALRWLKLLLSKLNNKMPTKKDIEQFCWETLISGQIIPGYGHAVLRIPDPRFIAQLEFSKKYLPEDTLIQLVSLLYEIAPKVLKKQGKVKNPWPNCDNITGAIQNYYGVNEDFFSVLFAVAISIGTLSNLVWNKALQYPIERPGSITVDQMLDLIK